MSTQGRSLYPWLRENYQTLSKDFSQDKLHHAILLCGASGMGKSQLVDRLVELIHCQSPVQNKACGQCQQCLLHQSSTHPDIYRVQRIDNKAQISIEQIRTISKKILNSGLVSKRRIVVIDELHLLTVSASNALLKVLEEPPKHVYFLLSSSQHSQLAATIISRCYQCRIKVPSANNLAAWLAKKSGQQVSPRQMAMFEYAPLQILHALEQDSFVNTDLICDLFIDLLAKCATAKPGANATRGANTNGNMAVLTLINALKEKDSVNAQQSIGLLQLISNNIVKGLLGVAPKSDNLISSDQQALVKGLPVHAMLGFGSDLAGLKKQLKNSPSLNPLLQLQSILVKLVPSV
ncbi:MAG: AAA family ATPase [Psychrobium sp.]|nr:AAA family ATPase [Psychrobium sp.]